MAFVDDDEVEKLGWNPCVVDDRHRFLGLYQFGRVYIFRAVVISRPLSSEYIRWMVLMQT